MNKVARLSALMALTLTSMQLSAQPLANNSENAEQPVKTTFWQKLMKPIAWLGHAWSDYDPEYVASNFYDASVTLSDLNSLEWFSMKTDDGLDMSMRSKLSSKIGITPAYKFLSYGYSIDVKAFKGTKGRNEFAFNLNSQLASIEFVRRRTGGDFKFNNLKLRELSVNDNNTDGYQDHDYTDMANSYDAGSLVKNELTGFNINIFTNHRKFSNPAAFDNNGVQLRSAGSPIIGIGYMHEKVVNNVSNVFFDNVMGQMQQSVPGALNEALAGQTFNGASVTAANALAYMQDLRDNNRDQFRQMMGRLYGRSDVMQLVMLSMNPDGSDIKNFSGQGMIDSKMPSTTKINDWHINLGYAYNIAFSRRVHLAMQAVVSPAYKHLWADNNDAVANITSEEFAQAFNKWYNGLGVDEPINVTKDDFCYSYNKRSFGLNYSAKASLVFNFNRWNAGVTAMMNSYNYHGVGLTYHNTYGSANIYLTYRFGRKKEFRWDGEKRQEYVMAALTEKDIEAMHDTMPKSNITETIPADGRVTYRTDNFRLTLNGCDLVKGPDGNYGTYEVQDGYITPGQDPEHRLKPGTVIALDANGTLSIQCGHDKNFRTANWWKSQLGVRQIPNNWYPEMLHYALCGKLTLWVRNYRFGTMEPVKMVIEDFCVSHGKEAKEFFQIASKQFESHSAYSIVGNVAVNDRKTRVYIESKSWGKKNTVNVYPLKSSTLDWMAQVPDDRSISRMSIPATHDAGTASLPENTLTSMGHTQNFTIAEQLEDGVRAFDIRLKRDMHFGHTMKCRDGYPETLDSINAFLKAHPSEFIIAMIGSDEGGKWSDEMKENYSALIAKYPGLFVEDFAPATKLGDVRGKVLVIKRQEACPFGKLLKFGNNTVFEYEGFHVEDVYKEHKTYKKIKIVENHLREAHECLDPNKWYITFNSIAWDPRHHKPYYTAWGNAKNVRCPMNPNVRTIIDQKQYKNFGMLFLDFYNNHNDRPDIVDCIIKSNFGTEADKDYVEMKSKK